MTRKTEPNIQNLPIRTPEGAAIKDALYRERLKTDFKAFVDIVAPDLTIQSHQIDMMADLEKIMNRKGATTGRTPADRPNDTISGTTANHIIADEVHEYTKELLISESVPHPDAHIMPNGDLFDGEYIVSEKTAKQEVVRRLRPGGLVDGMLAAAMGMGLGMTFAPPEPMTLRFGRVPGRFEKSTKPKTPEQQKRASKQKQAKKARRKNRK